MDLHLPDALPTEAERAAIDALLGPEPGEDAEDLRDGDQRASRGGQEARHRRDLLLPALHAANSRVGWISEGALTYICQRLTIPPAEAYGVATFYAMFSLTPRPPRVLHVCTDIACKANGSDAVCKGLEERLGPAGGRSGVNGEGAVWEESPCLGMCDQAPAALAFEAGDPPREQSVGHATAETLAQLARPAAAGTSKTDTSETALSPGECIPQLGDPQLSLLRRVGVVDPESLDDYRAHGGYQALRNALELGPANVIREVQDSKLMGRGGAAFPTGRKWDGTARQPDHPHYLICNADESEPGTFKDRVLMEGDPYALIEAMTIGAFAADCQHGYIYVRGEYPRATERLQLAIDNAHARGLLGENIMGHGFSFDIEIRSGAGAYICGEETALFNSIEGYRGEPRNKPPFPTEKGLFSKPTIVNNVETLVNVLPILTQGGKAFASVGTEGSTGTRLFCLSGSVRQPGVYEVPSGTTLRELLNLAGGAREGHSLQAVLMGGAAGGFVPPDQLDFPLSFEGAREMGTTLGSGVVLAFDDSVDIAELLIRIAGFFRDESCGQCVPCRVGSVRQEEALQRLASARESGSGSQQDDLALLREIGRAMEDASICGLGQTAWGAIESAIDRIGVFEEAKS